MERRSFVRLAVVGHAGVRRHGGAFNRGGGLGYLLDSEWAKRRNNVDELKVLQASDLDQSLLL